MNEPEKIDPRELSPLALAFVGDSVLELLVRQRLVEHHRLSAGRLNAEKVKYVSARAQFREEQLLEPLFTEEELAVFKRGRNAPWLEYILAGSNVDDYESLQYFQRQLDESGILAALVEKGVQENDTILIGDYQFDYIF